MCTSIVLICCLTLLSWIKAGALIPKIFKLLKKTCNIAATCLEFCAKQGGGVSPLLDAKLLACSSNITSFEAIL